VKISPKHKFVLDHNKIIVNQNVKKKISMQRALIIFTHLISTLTLTYTFMGGGSKTTL
jgi:hypothetical protein